MSRLSEHRITGVDYAAHTPKRPLGAMGNIGDDAALAMPRTGGHKPETAQEKRAREWTDLAERQGAELLVKRYAASAADCRLLLEMLGLAEPAGTPPRPPQAAVDPPGTAQVRQAAEVYLAERGGGIDGLYERIAAQLGGPDVDVTRWTKNLLARCKAGGWLVAGAGHGGSVAGPKLLQARGEGEPR